MRQKDMMTIKEKNRTKEYFLNLITNFLTNEYNFEVLITEHNQICIPIKDWKGDDKEFLTITFNIPKGRPNDEFNGREKEVKYVEKMMFIKSRKKD